MELSSLSENIVAVPYKRGTETLELLVNIDAFTPEFWREIKKAADKKLKEFEQLAKQAAQKKPKTKKRLSAAEKLNQQTKTDLEVFEVQARKLESERATNIDFLVPHILKGWDVVENGLPIAPSKEVLNKLPPQLIQELFDVCLKAAQTVKKRVESETAETSENTQDGSQGLRVVGQTG